MMECTEMKIRPEDIEELAACEFTDDDWSDPILYARWILVLEARIEKAIGLHITPVEGSDLTYCFLCREEYEGYCETILILRGEDSE